MERTSFCWRFEVMGSIDEKIDGCMGSVGSLLDRQYTQMSREVMMQ